MENMQTEMKRSDRRLEEVRIEELHDLYHTIHRDGEIEGHNNTACDTRETKSTPFWKVIMKRSDRFRHQG